MLDVLEGLARAAGAVRADREDAALGLERSACRRRGHLAGGFGFLRGLFFPSRVNGETTWGIASPARVTTTSSPTRTSLRARSSSCGGRGRDGDTADVDRLEHRERHQVAGPPHVPDDLEQLRRRRRRRELPGDRPPWLAADDAELPPQRPLVDLDYDSVDLIVELVRDAPPTNGSA